MIKRTNGWRQIAVWAGAAAVLMVFLLYIPTPYVAFEPGLAADVRTMVNAAEPDPQGDGKFLLTTVKMSLANYWVVARSWWSSNVELYRRSDVLQGATTDQYVKRVNMMMLGSQSDAVEAAYRAASVPYSIVPEALIIVQTKTGSALQPGDLVKEAGGKPVRTAEELLAEFRQIAADQTGQERTIRLTFIRDGKFMEERIKTSDLSAQADVHKLSEALGVAAWSESRRLVPADPKMKVSITTDEIGGPSAGLMFALQSYDELTQGDLTGGKIIAGTGTIRPDGTVGDIGGVGHKVTAAVRTGAEVFLAPERNAAEAIKKARSLGARLKVIPVRTLAEAIAELRRLSSRS
ncbi:PDZ domain-containing protein [Paenibacillus beijingensis]|uniref:Lon proteolytic domain-containing protein n=1 Tax=Paenibacillus beijingensis TaxID=1126833 RepID=A0A0D5NMX3_9BACL|nr:S16 family serine protease [Paenibacillus beijingensis]AJY76520.1 hypothetical protein VN24_20575 [Paenibacillus beijingensis]